MPIATPASAPANGVLARNTLLNLLGQLAPLPVAVFAIPLLIEGLGIERFGALALAWVAIGYSSFFDFGMGRALTRLVAERQARDRHAPVSSLIWTATLLMAVLGLFGAILSLLLSKLIVTEVLRIPDGLQQEVLYAFYVLSAAIPIVVITAGFRGVLEGYQRFGIVNAIRIPLGVFTFIGPLSVLPFSTNLAWVVAALFLGRFVAWLAYGYFCLRTVPWLEARPMFDRNEARPLFGFGTWMTVTNIVGPFMTYMDRFLIGALLSLASVAYYATPYEIIVKFLLIPGALVGVLFPAFAASYASDPARAATLFRRGVKYVFLALFPASLVVIALANEGLALWLGDDFARSSTGITQWLMLGIFVNALAHIPFAFIQGAGRPDVTAKLHLAQLLPYLLAVWWLLENFGLIGAAIAWTARAAVDAVCLFYIAWRMLPSQPSRALTHVGFAAAVLMSWLVFLVDGSVLYRVSVLLFLVITLSTVAWFAVLSPGERFWLRNLAGHMFDVVKR